MGTRKTTKKQGEGNELIPEEIVETITQNEPQQQQGEEKTLKSAMADFEKRTSEFTPESENKTQNTQQTTDNPVQQPSGFNPLNFEKNIKIKMFVGFCCLLLTGISTFILNKIKRTNVPASEMEFSEDEQESLMVYLEDEQIVQYIERIPTPVIATMHIGYMMYQKHSMLADQYKIQPKVMEEK